MTRRTRQSLILGLVISLSVGVFLLDMSTPRGLANGVLYAIIVLIALAAPDPRVPVALAVATTVLTVIGYVATPDLPGVPNWLGLSNRALSMIIIWVPVLFFWQRRRAEELLRRTNEALEQRVQERTRDLAAVNRALVAEVSERMQTEESLRKSEDALRMSEGRLAGILDIAKDAIISIDETRRIVLFNQGAAHMFGYQAEEVLGQDVDLLLPSHREGSGEAAPDGNEGRFAWPVETNPAREVLGRHKDGTEFPAEASVSALDMEGRLLVTVILRDVSERHRVEAQLRSLAAQLIAVQESERRRIARDLHDDINQRLGLAAFEMRQLDKRMGASAEAARPVVKSVLERIEELSNDVRSIAYRFHPTILEDLGLAAALQHLVDDFAARTGLKVVLMAEEPAQPVPSNIATCLYRVAQEGLGNVIKHARAAEVEMELMYEKDQVRLLVRDSGVGFEPRTVNGGGLGLVSIRERVRLVHGTVELNSRPGHGTSILVTVPLPAGKA